MAKDAVLKTNAHIVTRIATLKQAKFATSSKHSNRLLSTE